MYEKSLIYNEIFINIILAMPYKYNLSYAFTNVFLESFSERKFNVSIMLMEILSAHLEISLL